MVLEPSLTNNPKNEKIYEFTEFSKALRTKNTEVTCTLKVLMGIFIGVEKTKKGFSSEHFLVFLLRC